MKRIPNASHWPTAAIDFQPCPPELASPGLKMNIAIWPGVKSLILQSTSVIHLAADASPPEPSAEMLSVRMKAGLPHWDFSAVTAAEEIALISHVPAVLCRDPDATRDALSLIEEACGTKLVLNLVAANWNADGSGRTLIDAAPEGVRNPTMLPWGFHSLTQSKAR